MQYMEFVSKHKAFMRDDISSQCVVATIEELATTYVNAWSLNTLAITIPLMKILQQDHDNH